MFKAYMSFKKFKRKMSLVLSTCTQVLNGFNQDLSHQFVLWRRFGGFICKSWWTPEKYCFTKKCVALILKNVYQSKASHGDNNSRFYFYNVSGFHKGFEFIHKISTKSIEQNRIKYSHSWSDSWFRFDIILFPELVLLLTLFNHLVHNIRCAWFPVQCTALLNDVYNFSD